MDEHDNVEPVAGAKQGEGAELDRILSKREVAKMTGISTATIDRLRKRQPPAFPAPVDLSQRRRGWKSSVVRKWVDERPQAPT